MTIYEAFKNNISTHDILSYNMSDDEKLAYVFENINKEKLKEHFPELYYCLLAFSDRYK